MAKKSLAVRYRPKSFDDVVEQSSTKRILENQLNTGEVRNAYLFCGASGCGKTTCARIFANEINRGEGSPIELDAASNNGVDDMREIIQMAQTRSMESEYKVFIIDEAHMITTAGWNAMLKLIEEPPLKSIFIFCTTDPQKIPKTIMSRVQRYDFRRISQQSISDRLYEILNSEGLAPSPDDDESVNALCDALDYIARLSDGCMREAITMLDKCLPLSDKLNLRIVVSALGEIDYDVLMRLADALICGDPVTALNIVSETHTSGIDLRMFVKKFLDFVLDVNKAMLERSLECTSLPNIESIESWVSEASSEDSEMLRLLDLLVSLYQAIRWDPNPKFMIESRFMLFARRQSR